MKILFAEAVTKVDRLEQSKNSCKNCRSSTHTTLNCNQPGKVCQGSLGVHVFWKCPNYNIPSNRSNPRISAVNANPTGGIEHILLEDDNDFDPFSNTLEDFLAHKETQPRKRVRVEDIEDEADRVKFVSITSNASNLTNSTADSKPMAAKKPARPRKSRSIKDYQASLPANKATVQLMTEAKLSLTLQQICDLAPSFRAEVRRILVNPRKIKDSTKTGPENIYLSNNNREESGNCPRTLVKVNNLYYVNALLDRGAVPNIVSLDLIKKLGIKELLKDSGKYTTASGQKSQAFGIAQGITIYFGGKSLRFSAIIYNHDAFSLLLGRRLLHELKILTDWDLSKWYMKTGERTKVQISINFDTNYGIRRIAASDFISEDESEMEEATTTSETASSAEDSDHEIYVFQ